MNLKKITDLLFISLLFVFMSGFVASNESDKNTDSSEIKPNFLFFITDDQSWLHTSLESPDEPIQTPGFDRIAREGVYFENAFSASPSCAPSRASILTGKYPWQLEEGGLLFGGLKRKYQIITDLLMENGYEVAKSYKGYWPANQQDSIYHSDPFYENFEVEPESATPEGIAYCDYAASFTQFMDTRDADRPFFFWVGVSEPHRVYKEGIGIESGMNPDSVTVPGFLPDTPLVRSDILDYYYEINHQDKHLLEIVEELDNRGELENTIIIVTSDNGMPFPRAKANLYDYGTRVPLAILWTGQIESGKVEDKIVNLAELGPTILDFADIPIPSGMSTSSLKSDLSSKNTSHNHPREDFTVTFFERHTIAREGGIGYPSRALRNPEWLLIHNYHPERWPMGDPPPFQPLFYDTYGDVDASPTKSFMVENQYQKGVQSLFELSFGKRPEWELYHIPSDPENVNNLASDPKYREKKHELQKQLLDFLKSTNDPRITGEPKWDSMPFYLPWDDNQPVTPETHPELF